jgi:hypothetical protein
VVEALRYSLIDFSRGHRGRSFPSFGVVCLLGVDVHGWYERKVNRSMRWLGMQPRQSYTESEVDIQSMSWPGNMVERQSGRRLRWL